MLVAITVVSEMVFVSNPVEVQVPVPGTVTVILDVCLVAGVETLDSETVTDTKLGWTSEVVQDEVDEVALLSGVPTVEDEVWGPIPVMIVLREVLKMEETVVPCSSEVETPVPVPKAYTEVVVPLP